MYVNAPSHPVFAVVQSLAIFGLANQETIIKSACSMDLNPIEKYLEHCQEINSRGDQTTLFQE